MSAGPSARNRPRRKVILGVVFTLIGAPAVLASVQAAFFHVRNRPDGSFVSSGQRREYVLHVPESYDPTTPTPLVISLHGGATWPALQRDLSHWNRLADEDGFVVVYPAGTGKPKRWHSFDTGAGLERDVKFISDLIDSLNSDYNIDPARIYADGLSNGGGMAFVLSCRLADRIAAIGMVAPAQTLPTDWCSDLRPMPMMAFHGDADPIVPWEGGPMGGLLTPVRPVFSAVRDGLGRWAARNQCETNPVESKVAPDVVRLEYRNCTEGAPVVFYRLLGGGHTWPGGTPLPRWFSGTTNANVDATLKFWEFFQDHSLRQR